MTRDRTWPLEPERPGSIFNHLSVVLPWTSHFPSLGLHVLLIRRMGIVLTFRGHRGQYRRSLENARDSVTSTGI